MPTIDINWIKRLPIIRHIRAITMIWRFKTIRQFWFYYGIDLEMFYEGDIWRYIDDVWDGKK